ncbi:MAG: hypothetical protein FJ145_15615 [Deltaproteobacteria bacterium]|nr:hypothetical protein [Deltaproteobacteria bacterium]
MDFIANVANFSVDDSALTVAFADDREDPQDYVILSVAAQESEQDRKLGLEGVYLELCAEGRGGYKLIESIITENNKVQIQLDPSLAKKNDLPLEILITVKPAITTEVYAGISEIVRRLR